MSLKNLWLVTILPVIVTCSQPQEQPDIINKNMINVASCVDWTLNCTNEEWKWLIIKQGLIDLEESNLDYLSSIDSELLAIMKEKKELIRYLRSLTNYSFPDWRYEISRALSFTTHINVHTSDTQYNAVAWINDNLKEKSIADNTFFDNKYPNSIKAETVDEIIDKLRYLSVDKIK